MVFLTQKHAVETTDTTSLCNNCHSSPILGLSKWSDACVLTCHFLRWLQIKLPCFGSLLHVPSLPAYIYCKSKESFIYYKLLNMLTTSRSSTLSGFLKLHKTNCMVSINAELCRSIPDYDCKGRKFITLTTLWNGHTVIKLEDKLIIQIPKKKTQLKEDQPSESLTGAMWRLWNLTCQATGGTTKY